VVPIPDHDRGPQARRANLHPRRVQTVLLRRLTLTEGSHIGTNSAPLAGTLCDSLSPALTDASGPWLWRPLAHGEPLTPDDVAQVTGRTVGEVRHALAALPDTGYDEHGRIVGHDLTQRPSPHRFTIDGRQLFTWCALDTLMFPAVPDAPPSWSPPFTPPASRSAPARLLLSAALSHA
jgi:hypothetical protein